MPVSPNTSEEECQGEVYMMPRGEHEMSRLDVQHRLFRSISKGLIGPLINLDTVHAIADVGTGTGIWLGEVAELLESSKTTVASSNGADNSSSEYSRTYVGFDISSKQFPQSTPRGLDFVLHDITKPFPVEYRGAFDLVYVRLLGFGLDETSLQKAIANITEIIRPGGGVLQWQECDVTDMWCDPMTQKVADIQRLISEERVAKGFFRSFVPELIQAITSKQAIMAPVQYNNLNKGGYIAHPRSATGDQQQIVSLRQSQSDVLHLVDVTLSSSAGFKDDPFVPNAVKSNISKAWHSLLLLAVATKKAMLVSLPPSDAAAQQLRQELDYVDEILSELKDPSSELLDRAWGMNIATVVASKY